MHIFDQKCHRPGMPKHRYLRVEILISNVRARHKFFRLRSIVFMVCKHETWIFVIINFPTCLRLIRVVRMVGGGEIQ